MKNYIKAALVILLVVLIAGVLAVNYFSQKIPPIDNSIDNFEKCADYGYPILESYPRQCKTPDEKTFIEDIGNELEKLDLIRINNPRPNQEIKSPLIIKGEARGYWFFEASFPIRLFDARGREIAVAIGEAQTDWMVTDFVPFKATLIFEKPSTPTGMLIFEKDNPSGLPEHDDELEMPIKFNISEVDKTTTLDSGVMGQVLIGPQCPVVRIEDENCKDKPYLTSIEISLQNAPRLFRLIDTDNEAKFKITLEPGDYILRPKGGNPFPSCSEKEVSVLTHQFQDIILSCDTGIR